MTIVVEAPEAAPSGSADPSVFLAGSIEMGVAEDWQEKAIKGLTDHAKVIYNPRRKDWDSSWVQEMSNPQFREQVEWEINHLKSASHCLFYFDPATKSPITLMELGLCAATKPSTTFVCCPDGFWRKGNVDIVCAMHNVKTAPTLDKLLSLINRQMDQR